MGLALGGVACARRGSWVWAGALLGLAVTSQQFAPLVLAPLFVVAPTNRRLRFTGAAIGAAAVIVLPMVAVSSGRALGAILIGSGNTPSQGGTLLWELHLHGVLLVGCSRVLPIILAMVLASWTVRRLGPAVLEPVPLLALVATSLSFRLVFEQNLFGFYFMALAVALILLDAVRGHITRQLVAWLALLTLAFDSVPWGSNPIPNSVHPWMFQIVLVPIGVLLACRPLVSLRARGSILIRTPIHRSEKQSSRETQECSNRRAASPTAADSQPWAARAVHTQLNLVRGHIYHAPCRRRSGESQRPCTQGRQSWVAVGLRWRAWRLRPVRLVPMSGAPPSDLAPRVS